MTTTDWPALYEQKTEELTKAFSRWVNSYATDASIEKFVFDLTKKEHRTLQQDTMRIVCLMLDSWADDFEEGYFDLRNEWTVTAAHKIREFFKSTKEWWPKGIPRI